MSLVGPLPRMRCPRYSQEMSIDFGIRRVTAGLAAALALLVPPLGDSAGSTQLPFPRVVDSTAHETAIAMARTEGAITPDGLLLPDARIQGISAAEYVDVAGMADAKGLNMDEALARYAHLGGFMAFRDEVAVQYPQLYAGSQRTGENSWLIAMKGEVPQELLRDAVQLPFKIRIEGGATYSRGEFFDQALELSRNHPNSYVELDELASVLRVVSPNTVDPSSRVKPSVPGVTVEYIHDPTTNPEAGQEDSRLRGGALVNSQLAMSSFTLVSPTSGAIRMGTCNHCVGARDRVGYRLFATHNSDQTALNVLLNGANGLDLVARV